MSQKLARKMKSCSKRCRQLVDRPNFGTFKESSSDDDFLMLTFILNKEPVILFNKVIRRLDFQGHRKKVVTEQRLCNLIIV